VGGQVPETIPTGYNEARDTLRQWRLTTPLDRFHEIRRKFDAAGLDLYSYVMTIGDDFTDPEIDAVFRHMEALKVDKFCTNQTRVAMGPRMVPYAEKYKIRPAFHTHNQSSDPNEISSPESLAKVLAMSKYFMVNLDIGHYFDGGNDPLTYLKAHPDRITHLHVRDADADRKQVDIGTGVLHVDQMLRFVRDNHYDIAFIVEQVGHAGAANRNDGLKMNIEYMRQTLAS
jgi:sugar phosphate isomerase/epimerase